MGLTRVRQQGFTLIEALVAMTLIAVALMACLKAAGNMNVRQDEMQNGNMPCGAPKAWPTICVWPRCFRLSKPPTAAATRPITSLAASL
ncbi:MAG: prepilin-type N-terminal cleavage/methylation domain-containing protein [Limnobacter sp.]|nr:prepilin-type N-terminal cleavage/methylation domain-containing protein [Limnobacter sp.]